MESAKNVLALIIQSSRNNKNKNKHKHGFGKEMKLYSLYLFLTAGRKAYEHLVANFQNALPACSTVHNYLSDIRNIEEGVLEFDGILKYLKRENSLLAISVSEDQTKVTVRIRYDPKSECLVGFVSPTGAMAYQFIANSK